MPEVHAARAPGRYSSLFAHAVDDETQRLRSLAEALDAGTIELLQTLQPQPDWRCLDIGAGLGTVASWLAGRCPAGEVIATDLSLEHLGQVAGPNLRVIEHDVTADGFPERSFDLVFARFVFAHLPTREETLARVARGRVTVKAMIVNGRRLRVTTAPTRPLTSTGCSSVPRGARAFFTTSATPR